MATYLIPGVGLVEGSGQALLITGEGLVEFPSETPATILPLVSASLNNMQQLDTMRG